ncbi:aldose 1-epimerase family protein [Niabella insulamsoli]|uniref:aldose 1-epimerase family protein n=1 Tax=Niabella insulamsoli TaxID=3144874 RepID=UPI0031FBBEF5
MDKKYTLQNERMKIAVAAKGAELQQIEDLKSGQSYMWHGGEPWPKYAPVLFPIVGALKEGVYHFKGKQYQLPRHGFARDRVFDLHVQTPTTLSFVLTSDDATLAIYPFQFEFYINYILLDNGLEVKYSVINKGGDDMFFSVGGHPAFKLPLFAGDQYEDYTIEFEKKENTGRWLLDNGLIKSASAPLLHNSSILPIRKDLFYQDAIVLKHLNSSKLQLLSSKSGAGFAFDFAGFPYLGIWAAPNADFICIEPWCGIADAVDSSQELSEKEGIHKLASHETFERSWQFTTIG